MSGRALLSYSDIVEPSTISTAPVPEELSEARPVKRPRWSKNPPNENASSTESSTFRGHAHAHWDSSAEASTSVSYDAEIPTGSNPLSSGSTSQPQPQIQNQPLKSNELPQYGPFVPKKRQSNNKSKKNGKQTNKAPPTVISMGDSDFWDDGDLTRAWDAANQEYEVNTAFFLIMLTLYNLIRDHSVCMDQVKIGRLNRLSSHRCALIRLLSVARIADVPLL